MGRFSLVIASAILVGTVGCMSPKGATVQEKRAAVLDMRDTTLADFYKAEPHLENRVKNAAGYGVFSNIGTNIIFVTTGNGYGIVHNNKTGQDTYMKMAGGGVGLGIGVKDFRGLFIFNTESAVGRFADNGWSWGADADAAAKSGEKGGAANTAGAFGAEIEVYQLTKAGLALSAAVGGSKYWRDKELNMP